MLSDFEDIAADIGIEIPEDLGRVIELGAIRVRPGDAAPLGSLLDFQFLDAGGAERILEDWLGRHRQRGADYTLLPFGVSGGGDAYCCVQLEAGDIGIATIFHDQETFTLDYSSVSHWITAEYVAACKNLNDLEPGPEAGVGRMQAEVALLGDVLLPEHLEFLQGLLGAEVIDRPYKIGPKATERLVKSLLAQDTAEEFRQALLSDDQVELSVRPEWDE